MQLWPIFPQTNVPHEQQLEVTRISKQIVITQALPSPVREVHLLAAAPTPSRGGDDDDDDERTVIKRFANKLTSGGPRTRDPATARGRTAASPANRRVAAVRSSSAGRGVAGRFARYL